PLAGDRVERAARPRVELAAADGVSARDLRVFQQMLRGELPVEQGMKLVAHSGGWPIRTPQGFLFAAPATAERMSVAGEHTGWRPEGMKREGGLFWHHATIGPDRVLRYKLVSAEGNYHADPWARCYGHDENGEYGLTKAPARPHLERWPGISSGQLLPRALRVFVPDERPTHFLYVHDGQTLFDPAAPHGGWKLHESVGPRTLAIGIDNTPDRRHEYTHTKDLVGGEWIGGRAPEYVKLVEEVIRPFVEQRYGAPERVGIMGASLGGLVSFYQSIEYPDAYDFVGSLSGTMGWGAQGGHADRGPLMSELFRGRPKTKTVHYLDSGGAPNGRDNYDSNRATADALAGLGYAWDRELYHWHQPGAVHTEAEWAKRVHRPLGIFEAL
ncbi:hypothetical protein L6R52_43275, partial [Myxococcota bacterium]|nr:hypothetical protein [Myxococcota bacterium]